MNKLAIPAILAATVLVAGIFAFIPVEQASTVHDTITSTLAGANILVVSTAIADGADDLYSGTITFDRTTGTGAFEIISLYICDVEIGDDGGDGLFISYTLEGGTLVSDAGIARQNLLEITLTPNDCVDLKFDDFDSFNNIAFLGGDENTDLVLTLTETDVATVDDDANGATLHAVISGLDAATDMDVQSTTGVT